MTEYTLGLLNIDPKVTVSVFSDPIYSNEGAIREMKAANRRFAQQGAREITLIPRRNGKGWAKRKED